MKVWVKTAMVRFSTTLCPSDEPPPAKRLKIAIAPPRHQEDEEEEHHQQQQQQQQKKKETLPNKYSRTTPSSSTTTCSSDGGSSSAGPFGDLHASFDLDILDCNICMEVLSPPIFQCCNGHYTCHTCTEKMNSRCPSCAEPAGKIRNLGLEKIIESLKIRCKFWSRGCNELALPYRSKKIHEQKCVFSPRDCPLPDCNFSGRLNTFSSHFESCHSVETVPFCFDSWFSVSLSLADKYLLLQRGNDYYLLQAHEECVGKLLYVSHVLPTDSEDGQTYQMEVKAGKKCLTLASDVQSFHRGRANLGAIDFLLVPQCFLGNDGLQVKISIKSPFEAGTKLQ